MKQVPKVRKTNKSIVIFTVNKLSEDVGVLYLN